MDGVGSVGLICENYFLPHTEQKTIHMTHIVDNEWHYSCFFFKLSRNTFQ